MPERNSSPRRLPAATPSGASPVTGPGLPNAPLRPLACFERWRVLHRPDRLWLARSGSARRNKRAARITGAGLAIAPVESIRPKPFPGCRPGSRMKGRRRSRPSEAEGFAGTGADIGLGHLHQEARESRPETVRQRTGSRAAGQGGSGHGRSPHWVFEERSCVAVNLAYQIPEEKGLCCNAVMRSLHCEVNCPSSSAIRLFPRPMGGVS